MSSARRSHELWWGSSFTVRFWILVADIQCPYTLLMSQYHGFNKYSIGTCQFLFPCPPPSGDSLLVQRMAFHRTCEEWHDTQDPCYLYLAGNYRLDRTVYLPILFFLQVRILSAHWWHRRYKEAPQPQNKPHHWGENILIMSAGF